MFYLLDMAHERRQACPSVVVKEKQWSFSEKFRERVCLFHRSIYTGWGAQMAPTVLALRGTGG